MIVIQAPCLNFGLGARVQRAATQGQRVLSSLLLCMQHPETRGLAGTRTHWHAAARSCALARSADHTAIRSRQRSSGYHGFAARVLLFG